MKCHILQYQAYLLVGGCFYKLRHATYAHKEIEMVDVGRIVRCQMWSRYMFASLGGLEDQLE